MDQVTIESQGHQQPESAHDTYTSTISQSSASLPTPAVINGNDATLGATTEQITINGNENSNAISNTDANSTMSEQGSQVVDGPEVDDAASEDVSLALSASAARVGNNGSPAKPTGSSRGRGRGRWSRLNKNKVSKPAPPKVPSGRGRRQKVYDSLKAQAAHERAQELKQAYTTIAKQVKPALQELADRSINELLEDPAAFEKVPEYEETMSFLRERHAGALEACDKEREIGLEMISHVYEAETRLAWQRYYVSFIHSFDFYHLKASEEKNADISSQRQFFH